MAKVIDILSKQPHLEGEAFCIECGHKWQAVVPTGTVALDCPECKLQKGIFQGIALPTETPILHCRECDLVYFAVTENQVTCVNCGEWYDR